MYDLHIPPSRGFNDLPPRERRAGKLAWEPDLFDSVTASGEAFAQALDLGRLACAIQPFKHDERAASSSSSLVVLLLDLPAPLGSRRRCARCHPSSDVALLGWRGGGR